MRHKVENLSVILERSLQTDQRNDSAFST